MRVAVALREHDPMTQLAATLAVRGAACACQAKQPDTASNDLPIACVLSLTLAQRAREPRGCKPLTCVFLDQVLWERS